MCVSAQKRPCFDQSHCGAVLTSYNLPRPLCIGCALSVQSCSLSRAMMCLADSLCFPFCPKLLWAATPTFPVLICCLWSPVPLPWLALSVDSVFPFCSDPLWPTSVSPSFTWFWHGSPFPLPFLIFCEQPQLTILPWCAVRRSLPSTVLLCDQPLSFPFWMSLLQGARTSEYSSLLLLHSAQLWLC